jgi:acetyltransferase-like isoleucine patch superfamily enzyme
MPTGIKEIEESAFFGCTSLSSINLEEGLTKIGDTAFAQCYSLESIDLPTSLEEVGVQAFYGTDCVVKTSEGVSTVDGWVVGAPASITKMTLATDTVGIANGVFAECLGLVDVYYGLDAEAFARIKVGEDNEPLGEAEIHYN